MNRLSFALLAFAMSACALRAPVHYSVNIDLDRDKERVRVTSVTELQRSWGNEAIRKRLDPLREALAPERDDWSGRFQQINPETERVSVERQHGEPVPAEHTGAMEQAQLAR